MPDWLPIVFGLLAGLALVYGILLVCFRLEERARTRKRRLAEASGEWDNGHGLTGGIDPS